MPVPNLQEEFTSHLLTILSEAYGKTASGDNWIEDPDNNVKNKYSIITEYRQLTLDQIKELIKARMNAVLGVFIMTNVGMRLQSNHMKGKSYAAELAMQLYMGTTNLRHNQLQGTRVVYEMSRDLNQVIIDNPLTLTGNPTIALKIQNSDADNTDDEVDFIKALIQIPQANLKNVS